MEEFLRPILGAAVALGIVLAIGLGIRALTDETNWVQSPTITEDGELQLHVKHEDGLPFTGPDGYSNVVLATLEGSKRNKRYENVVSVPSSYADYLGIEGLKVAGFKVPQRALNVGTLHACVFLKGDSVGCKSIAMQQGAPSTTWGHKYDFGDKAQGNTLMGCPWDDRSRF